MKKILLFIALTFSLGSVTFLSGVKQNPSSELMKIGENNLIKCSICHEMHNCLENDIRILECGHAFHKECIEDWEETCNNSDEMEKTCPICREKISYQEEESLQKISFLSHELKEKRNEYEKEIARLKAAMANLEEKVKEKDEEILFLKEEEKILRLKKDEELARKLQEEKDEEEIKRLKKDEELAQKLQEEEHRKKRNPKKRSSRVYNPTSSWNYEPSFSRNNNSSFFSPPSFDPSWSNNSRNNNPWNNPPSFNAHRNDGSWSNNSWNWNNCRSYNSSNNNSSFNANPFTRNRRRWN